MKKIIFACVHNAGRSQIAAAWARHLAGERLQVLSAGTAPGPHINLVVMEAMREVGIYLAGIQPQKLTPEMTQGADLLITMGCGESCPVAPGVRRVDWPITDTRGQPIEMVRTIRDEIQGRIVELLRSEGVLKA
ncbi:MAG: arsenate reductase ArsC [Terriglobales bacterium]